MTLRPRELISRVTARATPFNHYAELVAGGLALDHGVDPLSHCALGLTEEAGEVAGLVKKSQYAAGCLNHAKLEEELGDALWYIQAIANQLGFSLEGLASSNIRKLQQRYPERYRCSPGCHFCTEAAAGR